jgi:hypothetical protein
MVVADSRFPADPAPETICDWCGWWNSPEQFCSERCRFEWLTWQVVLLRMLDDGSKLVVPSTR